MTQDAVIAALNQLLSAEQQGLATRVVESEMFVSPTSVRAAELVRRMADRTRHNREQLVDLILDIGGQPAPRTWDVRTADLHYQELGHVLPQLIGSQAKLRQEYRTIIPRLAGNDRATELANRIAVQHESDLHSLKELAASPAVVNR